MAWFAGPSNDISWAESTRPADFFDAKGAVEAVFAEFHAEGEFVAAEDPALAPGRTAEITVSSAGGIRVGVVGELQNSPPQANPRTGTRAASRAQVNKDESSKTRMMAPNGAVSRRRIARFLPSWHALARPTGSWLGKIAIDVPDAVALGE